MSVHRASLSRSTEGWTALSDRRVLGLRVRDLGLRLENTRVAALSERLRQEIAHRGMSAFRPECYLSAEWCTVEGETLIGVPFYLAHPRLARLEKRFMGEVEGGSDEWCLRLLRHEAGHCLDHAYGLSRTAEWRRVFGDPEATYDPDHYEAVEGHPDFVEHLENGYAQAHPDEDFAETFAVWLDPERDWRAEYARRPVALAKLQYVDRLAATLGGRNPRRVGGTGIWRAERLTRTLAAHYARRVEFERGARRGR